MSLAHAFSRTFLQLLSVESFKLWEFSIAQSFLNWKHKRYKTFKCFSSKLFSLHRKHQKSWSIMSLHFFVSFSKPNRNLICPFLSAFSPSKAIAKNRKVSCKFFLWVTEIEKKRFNESYWLCALSISSRSFFVLLLLLLVNQSNDDDSYRRFSCKIVWCSNHLF